MSISSSKLYPLFKYAVYAFLTANILFFYLKESAAIPLQFPGGVGLHNLREAYAATIDTTAWVILLLMFELETWVLDDESLTPRVSFTLHTLRALCCVAIVMAFVGYYEDLRTVSDTIVLAGVTDLCALPPGDWSWSYMFGKYMPITEANCATLSDSETFVRFRSMQAVVDPAGLTGIIRLARADVINAGTWILVVLILEIDVRLQARNRYEGLALYASNALKCVLYSTLLLLAIYWGFKGDFVDFWDAFLWLVAFAFIELNVLEWRAEDRPANS